MGTQAIYFRGSRERLSSGEPEGHSQTELLSVTQPLAIVRDLGRVRDGGESYTPASQPAKVLLLTEPLLCDWL